MANLTNQKGLVLSGAEAIMFGGRQGGQKRWLAWTFESVSEFRQGL